MPDQHAAADEHALLQEITAPLARLPDDALPIAADVDFPIVLRGYDRLAVDAYVKKTAQLVAEMQATRSPDAAVRRALDRVGEEVSGVLQRAHETAEQITSQSRREAEERLEASRQEAAQIVSSAQQQLRDLDAETDRIWAERRRIIEDAHELAAQLTAIAEEAGTRFPPEAPEEEPQGAEGDEGAGVDGGDEVAGPEGELAGPEGGDPVPGGQGGHPRPVGPGIREQPGGADEGEQIEFADQRTQVFDGVERDAAD